MWSVFCCRRGRPYNQLSSVDTPGDRDNLSNGLPAVELDISTMGQNVVVIKNGRRICGSGAAVATTAVHQNKAYWEIKVQSTADKWGVGLATRKCNLNRIPLGGDGESWVLVNGSQMMHQNRALFTLPPTECVQEGDVLGLSYDHVDLQLYVNGKPLNSPVTGIRGTVYPVVFVDEGAILDVIFEGFYHQPPHGFSPLLIEKQIF